MSKGCLRGRPFGGVASFVKDSIASRTKLIKSASRFVILQIDDIVLINVYLPCVSNDNWDVEYLDCLTCIMNTVSELHYTYIIFAGDMNVDFSNNCKGCKYNNTVDNLLTFAEQLGLKFLGDKLDNSQDASTFRVVSSGAKSVMDHISVSESL